MASALVVIGQGQLIEQSTVDDFIHRYGDFFVRVRSPRVANLVEPLRAGGGANHRIGLYDAVMLKENHIRVAGTVAEAIARARAAQPGLPLIVEVETLDQLREALASL